jgi:Ala-tRNA(Pro) deacylase
MAIPKKVETYLKKANKKFDQISHKTVYTAYDLSQTLKTELKDIAKALLVKADKAYVIVVVPASARVDLKKLKAALGVKKVSIPDEKVMVKVFKVKPGAITAFGKLHKVETIVDKSLLKTKDVILQAGSFTDSVRMKVKDFIELEEARLASFAQKAGYKLPKPKAKPKKKVAAKKKATKKKK